MPAHSAYRRANNLILLVAAVLLAAIIAGAFTLATELLRPSRQPAIDVNYQWPPVEWRTRAAGQLREVA